MKLSTRQVKLLIYAYNNSTESVKNASQALGVTVGTIRSEIKNLQDLLSEYGTEININKKNFIVVSNYENLVKLIDDIGMLTEFDIESQILLTIILQLGYITIQEIADILYVSKSLIDKKLPIILKSHKNDLSSTRHYGIRFHSNELDRRTLFVEMLRPYVVGNNFEEEISRFNSLHFPIFEYFTCDQVQKAQEIIEIILAYDEVTFTDDSICQIFLYALIMLYRNEEDIKIDIRIDNGIEDSQYNPNYLAKYKRLVDQIGQKTSFDCFEREKHFLLDILISLRKYKLQYEEDIIFEMEPTLNIILAEIKDHMKMDLTDDVKLSKEMSLHIYSSILRNNHIENYTENWNILEFRRQYPIGTEMANIAAKEIIMLHKIDITDADLLYLSFHFQAAVERKKSQSPKINTVIICNYNFAALSLICERIKRRFSELNIRGVFSLHEIKKVDFNDVELVITTEKIPNLKIKTIYITLILRELELNVIRDFVERKKLNKKLLFEISEAEILHINDITSKEDVIKRSLSLLKERGLVGDDYIQSVLDRESISSTHLKYIAVPHGNPNYVNKTKLIITRMMNPVKWGNVEVHFVFIFAYSNQFFSESPMLMETFYRNLAKPSVEERIMDLREVSDLEFKKNLVEILM